MISFVFCLAAFWLVLALVGVIMVLHAQIVAPEGLEDKNGFHMLPTAQGSDYVSQASPALTDATYEFFSITSENLA